MAYELNLDMNWADSGVAKDFSVIAQGADGGEITITHCKGLLTASLPLIGGSTATVANTVGEISDACNSGTETGGNTGGNTGADNSDNGGTDTSNGNGDNDGNDDYDGNDDNGDNGDYDDNDGYDEWNYDEASDTWSYVGPEP